MPSIKVAPGKQRPLPVLSNARFVVALTGMVKNDDGAMVPHSAIAQFPIMEDSSRFQLAVPHTGYALYEINVQRHLIEPTPPEVELAHLVINAIPRDVWDACVAALRAESARSIDTVLDILHSWGEQLVDLASVKPLEPDE